MSSSNISRATLKYIHGHLPTEGDGLTPKQLHFAVGNLSSETIYLALRRLSAEGRATFSGGFHRRKYLRAA